MPDVTKLKALLKLEVLEMSLDIIGIFDPTGAADLASAVLAAKRGDWWSVGISGLSLFAGLGDLAKVGKLGRYAQTVERAISLAKTDSAFAKAISEPLTQIRVALSGMPLDKLPPQVSIPLQRIRHQLDAFFQAPIKSRAAAAVVKEVVEHHRTIEAARNRAIEWLTEKGVSFGPHYKRITGRLGRHKGSLVGVEASKPPYWSLRIDFDPNKGPHYNVTFGKGDSGQKLAVTFPAPPGKTPEDWIADFIRGQNKM